MQINIAPTHPRPALVALAFALGDAWGHVSHGATMTHRLASFVMSFLVVYALRSLSWRDMKRASAIHWVYIDTDHQRKAEDN